MIILFLLFTLISNISAMDIVEPLPTLPRHLSCEDVGDTPHDQIPDDPAPEMSFQAPSTILAPLDVSSPPATEDPSRLTPSPAPIRRRASTPSSVRSLISSFDGEVRLLIQDIIIEDTDGNTAISACAQRNHLSTTTPLPLSIKEIEPELLRMLNASGSSLPSDITTRHNTPRVFIIRHRLHNGRYKPVCLIPTQNSGEHIISCTPAHQLIIHMHMPEGIMHVYHLSLLEHDTETILKISSRMCDATSTFAENKHVHIAVQTGYARIRIFKTGAIIVDQRKSSGTDLMSLTSHASRRRNPSLAGGSAPLLPSHIVREERPHTPQTQVVSIPETQVVHNAVPIGALNAHVAQPVTTPTSPEPHPSCPSTPHIHTNQSTTGDHNSPRSELTNATDNSRNKKPRCCGCSCM